MSEPRVGPTLRVVLESFWEVIDFMSEEKIEGPLAGERILPLPLVGEIKDSYLNYAMSVIVGRALPDVRDGLKPVQRRVLYAMSELGLRHNSAYKKSARIVGETMGKYHPHGDSSIYDTMVRLAQDWSLRYCLVDGQGNFGSVDGDRAAAMRYTEARLHELGELMLADIDEDTVEWGPNFDESLKEPLSLPSVLPNLLVNGSTGIAVGMATNIPPHNLREVTDVLCWLLEEGISPEEASLADLMERLPGPDFPTGGQILGRQGIYDAYRTGRGKVIVRGRMHVEDGRRGKVNVIVTEIPYAVNKTTLIETMVKAAQDKVIDGIQDIRDESNREGMRIVLELNRDANPDLVMRQLYKRTQLQATFGVINLALDRQTPRLLPLASILGLFLSYRRDVVRRRTQFRLNKASARAHIVEGLLRAVDRIDEVIHLIREAANDDVAERGLIDRFGFSQLQAQAILDMRLRRLTGLQREKLEAEMRQLQADIASYERILGDPRTLDGVIRDELADLGKRFGDERRTEILDSYLETPDEQLIPESDIVVVLSKDGLLKRQDLESYALQGRGGAGGRQRRPGLRDPHPPRHLLLYEPGQGHVAAGLRHPGNPIGRKGSADRLPPAPGGRGNGGDAGQRGGGRGEVAVRLLPHAVRHRETRPLCRAHGLQPAPPRHHPGRGGRDRPGAPDPGQGRPPADDGGGEGPARPGGGVPAHGPQRKGRPRHEPCGGRPHHQLRRGG